MPVIKILRDSPARCAMAYLSLLDSCFHEARRIGPTTEKRARDIAALYGDLVILQQQLRHGTYDVPTLRETPWVAVMVKPEVNT